MAFDDMDDLHLRIARVTEDLRKIQQELNCASMQAPSDPELMEALNSLSEIEPIETLRVALIRCAISCGSIPRLWEMSRSSATRCAKPESQKTRTATPRWKALSSINSRVPMN